MLDQQDIARINQLMEARERQFLQMIMQMNPVRPIGFVPGITTPIGQIQVVTFQVTAPNLDTGTDAVTLSAEVGFLWQELSIRADRRFDWKLHTSGYDTLTIDGGTVDGRTFAGEGQEDNLVWGHKLATAQFNPGGTIFTIEATDTAGGGGNNVIDITFAGVRVRPGSQFQQDLNASLEYMGMGIA